MTFFFGEKTIMTWWELFIYIYHLAKPIDGWYSFKQWKETEEKKPLYLLAKPIDVQNSFKQWKEMEEK